MPISGFRLDGDLGRMKAFGVNIRDAHIKEGTFEGSLIHEALVTVEDADPQNTTIPANNRWHGSQLYNALSGLSDRAITNNWARGSSSLYAFYGQGTALYTGEITVDFINFTAPFAMSGTVTLNLVKNSSSGFGASLFTVYKNGSSISTFSFTNTMTKNTSVSLATGDVCKISYTVPGATTMGITYTISFPISGKGSAQYANGVLGSYNLSKRFLYDRFYNEAVSLSSPVSFSRVLTHVLASSVLGQITSLKIGVLYKVTGSLTIEGTSRSVHFITKSANSVTVYYHNGTEVVPYIMQVNDAIEASYGAYDISGTFSVIEQEAGIEVRAITPMVDATSPTTVGGTDIGNGAKRVRNITGSGNITGFANISAAEINTEATRTTNKVWGAVAN
jgi:hypothetical protein